MIRAFKPEDLPALQKITTDVFGPGSIDYHLENRFGLIGGHDWKWRKIRHVEWDLKTGTGQVFVCEEDGKVVGYITITLDREARIGRMVNLAVDEAHQNRGIAHRLIERALQFIKEEGMEVAKIETLVGNVKGEHIFPTLGFVEVARQIHYFKKL